MFACGQFLLQPRVPFKHHPAKSDSINIGNLKSMMEMFGPLAAKSSEIHRGVQAQDFADVLAHVVLSPCLRFGLTDSRQVFCTPRRAYPCAHLQTHSQSKLNYQGTTGFSPWFHLPVLHSGCLFLTHTHIESRLKGQGNPCNFAVARGCGRDCAFGGSLCSANLCGYDFSLGIPW